MAKSASARPPASASMWPASAMSARLPDQSAPITSTTRNPHVSARVAVRRPREREAAVCRWECASIERIVAGSGANHASLVIVDVRFGVPEEDQDRVLVELGATDGDRWRGNELLGLAV